MIADMQVTLEIDTDSEPITGRLRDEDGTETPFTGMLQLLSLLERIRREADDREPRRDTSSNR